MLVHCADPLHYLQQMRHCYSKPESEWTPITQKDVKEGTYRILKSGCYFLATDIEFSPNDGCCDYWPDLLNPPYLSIDSGSDSINRDLQRQQPQPKYPMGPYALGFFAAITIEADNVVLDLNGKTLSASLVMSLKQRFMNLIQVSTAKSVTLTP